jgi:ribosome-binding protein aMBF1 (putative translation factor)
MPPMKEVRFFDFLKSYDVISSSQAESDSVKSILNDIYHIVRYKYVNMKLKPLTSAQIRAARALLRWSAEDLARESTLGVTTIRRAELTDGQTSMTTANDLAVRRALEAAGVEFIDDNGGGPGVRLRERASAKKVKK